MPHHDAALLIMPPVARSTLSAFRIAARMLSERICCNPPHWSLGTTQWSVSGPAVSYTGPSLWRKRRAHELAAERRCKLPADTAGGALEAEIEYSFVHEARVLLHHPHPLFTVFI